MKNKPLSRPQPLVAHMPMGGFTSCLPPLRRKPPAKPSAPPVNTSVRVAGEVVDTNYGGYDAEYFDEQFGEGDDTRDTRALDNLSDKELQVLAPIVEALKTHDWYYDYSDDQNVWRSGNEQRTRINALLASIPPAQARALWAMYAPAAFGSWRLQ